MPRSDQYKGVPNAHSNVSIEEIEPSTLETIDLAFYDFINDIINNKATTNKGWKKVHILWATAERAFLSKDEKEILDSDGSLILPLASIERTTIQKSLTRKGMWYGLSGDNATANRGGRIMMSRRVVRDKTNNFSVADNIKKFDGGDDYNRTPSSQAYYPKNKNSKVVYETLSMPLPVSIDINYAVTIRSNYIQQMNEMLSPFITLGSTINSFVIKRDGHKYEAFVQPDFSQENTSDLGAEQREFRTTITFSVLGYLIGEGPNGERPKIIKKENAVKVKMGRERVIIGDIPDYGDGKSFYRD
jgi:hypothetical protein